MNEVDILNNAIHNLEGDIPITWDWKTMDYTNGTSVDGAGTLEFVCWTAIATAESPLNGR